VTAVPETVTWSPGPGVLPVECRDGGSPYNPNLPDDAQRTSCSYTYVRSSAGQPNAEYAAWARTRWRVTWRASNGTIGSLPPLERTTRFSVRVAEVQTVVTESD
jgi:hypothetical protein